MRAGIKRVARTEGVKDGLPLLADGRALKVSNVIWCSGFESCLSWIDLPIMGASGEPRQTSGLVEGEEGLFFVGQHLQHSMSSAMIHKGWARRGLRRQSNRRAAGGQGRRRGRALLGLGHGLVDHAVTYAACSAAMRPGRRH